MNYSYCILGIQVSLNFILSKNEKVEHNIRIKIRFKVLNSIAGDINCPVTEAKWAGSQSNRDV